MSSLTSVISVYMPEQLTAVFKTNKSDSSLRITLLKEIAERLNVSESKHIGFSEING